jgi:cytochrome c biogenesis protein CcmG/thiol:disulfide interchange protein DsbE
MGMGCPECGAQLMSGARFCHQCGWDSKLAAAGKASSTATQRPAWKRWAMGITLVLSSLLMLWLLLLPREDAAASLVPGQAAPDFDLPSLSGGRVRLADLKGKPVVLNFWASWCTPCRREMPDFQEVLNKYKDQGLQVYGVNVGESEVAVASFIRTIGVDFPVLLDLEEKAQTAYKILPLPTTFFIDRSGVIRAVYPYQMSRAQMEAEVIRLLAR